MFHGGDWAGLIPPITGSVRSSLFKDLRGGVPVLTGDLQGRRRIREQNQGSGPQEQAITGGSIQIPAKGVSRGVSRRRVSREGGSRDVSRAHREPSRPPWNHGLGLARSWLARSWLARSWLARNDSARRGGAVRAQVLTIGTIPYASGPVNEETPSMSRALKSTAAMRKLPHGLLRITWTDHCAGSSASCRGFFIGAAWVPPLMGGMVAPYDIGKCWVQNCRTCRGRRWCRTPSRSNSRRAAGPARSRWGLFVPVLPERS
jgi:hypothetical protein